MSNSVERPLYLHLVRPDERVREAAAECSSELTKADYDAIADAKFIELTTTRLMVAFAIGLVIALVILAALKLGGKL